jgi:ketosteroid isomerase-like protein
VTASSNLDLVRSIYSATERGDYTWAAWAHPEIEFVIVDGPTPGNWKGIAAMAAGWRDYLSAWQEHRSVTEEYRQLDGERVLVLVGVSGRGKTSGLDVGELPARGASLFHVRDAKVTRLVLYFDRDRALADLGLAPEADSQR